MLPLRPTTPSPNAFVNRSFNTFRSIFSQAALTGSDTAGLTPTTRRKTTMATEISPSLTPAAGPNTAPCKCIHHAMNLTCFIRTVSPQHLSMSLHHASHDHPVPTANSKHCQALDDNHAHWFSLIPPTKSSHVPFLKGQSLACGVHDTDRHPSSPISIRFRCSYNLIQHHTIPSEFNIYLVFNNENLLRMMDNALAPGGASNKRNLSMLYTLVDFNKW